MKNKILSLLLAVVLICSFTTVSFAVVDDVPVPSWLSSSGAKKFDTLNERSGAAYDLLSYTGVIAKARLDIDSTKDVTRAEAVAAAIRLVVGDAVAEAESTPYSDVSSKHEYINEIAMAKQMGLCDAKGTKFMPDEPALPASVARYIVVALGLDVFVKNDAYLTYAMSNDIFNGVSVSGTTPITWEQLLRILQNALHLSVTEARGVDADGTISGVEVKDTTYLEEKHGITLMRGVVTAAGNVGIYDASKMKADQIAINYAKYTSIPKVDLDWVGRSVYAYVDNNANNMIALFEDRNEVYEVEKHRYLRSDANTLYYETETGDEEEIAVRASAAVTYNDVYYGSFGNSSALFDASKTYTLIDNNKDGQVDVVQVRKSEERLVTAVSAYSEIIAFAYGKDSIHMNDPSINLLYCELSGQPAEVSDILANDIMSLYVGTYPDGTKLYRMDIHRESIEAVLEEIITVSASERYFVVDGETYPLTETYIAYLAGGHSETLPTAGKTARFYLNKDGEIAASKVSSDYSFAYLLGVEDGGFDGQAQIWMYLSNGKEAIYPISDKVLYYNGTSVTPTKMTGNDLAAALNQKASPVAYKVSDDGVLTEIALPMDRTSYPHASITYPLTKDKVVSSGDRLYTGYFYNKYKVSSSYVILYPNALDSAYASVGPDYFSAMSGMSDRYGDDYYFNSETVTLYNVDKFFKPAYVTVGVQSSLSGGAGAPVDDFTQTAVIEKITKAIDSSENVGYRISYRNRFGLQSAMVIPDVYVQYETGENYVGAKDELSEFEFGDVVQISKNFNDEIESIRMIFNANERGDYRVQNSNNATISATTRDTTGFSRLAVVYGKVVDRSGGTFLVNLKYANETADILSPYEVSGLYDTPQYILVDTAAKKTQLIAASDILPGDEIVMRKRYNHVSDVYIYR